MNDDRFRDLAIEHVLYGLDGAELDEFEAELRRRGETGERALERLRETVASLGIAAPPIEPPPELRSRVLARIAKQGADASDVPAVDSGARARRTAWVSAAIAAGFLSSVA